MGMAIEMPADAMERAQEDKYAREAKVYRIAAGALMLVLIGFGMLHLWGVI